MAWSSKALVNQALFNRGSAQQDLLTERVLFPTEPCVSRFHFLFYLFPWWLLQRRDPDSIPGSGRSSEAGNGNPFQYSSLKNHMDHGVAKSQTQLSDFTFTLTMTMLGLCCCTDFSLVAVSRSYSLVMVGGLLIAVGLVVRSTGFRVFGLQ